MSRIGEYAFAVCTNLGSISIPGSVNSIGVGAFGSCFGLTNINFSTGLVFIQNSAFEACNNLTSVAIPSGVTSVGDSVFEDCSSLTNVIIPASVTSIGENAFERCYNLTSAYFLGNALIYDGQYIFAADDNVTIYYLPTAFGWDATMDSIPTTPIFLSQPFIRAYGQAFGPQTNGFGFTILWATNVPVVVEATTNLSNPDWQPLQTNLLTRGSSYFTDPDWTNHSSRFYRLRSPQ